MFVRRGEYIPLSFKINCSSISPVKTVEYYMVRTDILQTSNRDLSQLALELLRGDDHANANREPRLERVSDFHVFESGVCPGKYLPSSIAK